MQTLDCGCFGPLKYAYTQERDAFFVSDANQLKTQRNVDMGLFKCGQI
jgi:hypothetical protein